MMHPVTRAVGTVAAPPQLTPIHPQQRQLHVVTEALSVAVTVPFWLWLSRELKQPWARALSLGLGVGALVVDGVLVYRFVTGKQAQPLW